MPNDLLYQLLQQGPQAAPPPELDANGMDANEASMMPQASVPVGKTGGLKARLTNALSAMSDSLLHSAGVETPDQKATRAAELQQTQARTSQLQQMSQQLTQQDVPDDMAESLGMPKGMGLRLPANKMADLIKELAKNKGKMAVTGANNDSRESIASDKIDSAEKIADKKIAAQAMNHADMMKIAKDKSNLGWSNYNLAKERADLQKSLGGTPAFAKVGMGAFDDALAADKRLEIMKDALANPNGQNDVAMLFNHIGMTLSQQKGARITNAEIERAIKTRDLPGGLMQEWDKLQSGRFLTPSQREQMVELGVKNREVAWESARRKAQFYGVTKEPAQSPKLPNMGGGVVKWEKGPDGVPRPVSK